jgi:hypothetical protein
MTIARQFWAIERKANYLLERNWKRRKECRIARHSNGEMTQYLFWKEIRRRAIILPDG